MKSMNIYFHSSLRLYPGRLHERCYYPPWDPERGAELYPEALLTERSGTKGEGSLGLMIVDCRSKA